MTSKDQIADHAFVWIWLPGATEPVVAGRLDQDGEQLTFNYGRSYLAREDAIAIYEPELPLRAGRLPLPAGLSMPSALRDAAPDAWGRRVILNRMIGTNDEPKADLGELTFLLQSGSDRIGALDFQQSATTYVPRVQQGATLEALQQAADRVERGLVLPPALDQAINHGTSIGGARPKAMIVDDEHKYIAKFSSSNDLYSVVKAEFIAMRLAAKCALDVASVSLTKAAKKDVLLIERFDRTRSKAGWERKALVSALTMLGLDEMMARYASYEDFADIIRARFDKPKDSLRELYGRIVFNVLCGNTDDHARNHAAFWDGKRLRLTPAYDICPQGRTGNEATQAMLLHGDNRFSTLASCLMAAPKFLLTGAQASTIIRAQIKTIAKHWAEECKQAELSEADLALLAGRQFLNPFCIEGLGAEHDAIAKDFTHARAMIT